MRRSTKVWLWFALILCAATTVLNASYGRIPSVVVAIVSLIGLCLLLFKQKKQGFCSCVAVMFFLLSLRLWAVYLLTPCFSPL